MPRLVILSEGFTGTAFDLKTPTTTVGRVEENNIHIPDASVSSRHCEIDLRGAEVFVRDLGSTNGTFIDGNQVQEGALKPGQILRLGQIDIRLESGAPASGGRKSVERTMVIPQGVKLDDLDQSGTRVINKFDKDSPFQKKSNKTNWAFLAVGLILAVVILGFLIMAYKNMNQ